MRRTPLLPALLLALALPLGGCLAVGAAAGYGVVQWARNEAWRTYRTTVPAAFEAARATLVAQGYPVPPDARLTDPTAGRIEAGDAEVRVEAYPNDLVRVRIRVGTFSTQEHRRRAGLLLEGITQRLAPGS